MPADFEYDVGLLHRTENICLPLPNAITKTVTTYEAREQFIVKFLEERLPATDSKNVLEELKRSFILDKHKSLKKKSKHSRTKSKQFLGRRLLRHMTLGKNHGLTYMEILPLNHMWLGYLKHNLSIGDFSNLPTSPVDPNWESVNQRLMKADYHGAIISVVRSKDTNSVGATGIILQETKHCFTILTPKNTIKTIPKDSSVFKFHLPGAYLEVFGKEIAIKPAERCVKKFKANHLGTL